MDHGFTPGTLLSHYRVLSRLGAGGMGVVYLAEDTQLRRKVAIKVLAPELTRDAAQLQRFRKEALAASSLSHPNIVTVYEVGSDGATDFIVSELIEGETLRTRLQRGPLALEEALDIAVQVAAALAAAHKAGITHRDVKPDNVMLRDDGYVKLLDFGLAKLAEPFGGESTLTAAPVAPATTTQPGTVLGTLRYMSPEQVRGMPLDARTDLFSLGAVLYEMVGRRLPHGGRSSLEIASAILTTPPPSLSSVRPDVPPQLDRVVSRLLDKDRERRYQSTSDLVLDLKHVKREVEALTSRGRQVRSARRRALLAAGAAVLFAALAFEGYRRLAPGRGGPVPSRQMVTLTDSGRSPVGAISPNGKYLAYAVEDDTGQSLWVREVSTTTVSRLVPSGPAAYWGTTFSPDDGVVFFVRAEKDAPRFGILYQVPILGGEPRRVVSNVSGPVAVSPDGRRLAFLRYRAEIERTALIIANVDGSGERELAVSPATAFLPKYGPAWSPDGTRIAWPRLNPEASSAYDITAVSAEDGSETRLSRAPVYHARQLAWPAGGTGLLIAGQERASAFWPQILRLVLPAASVERLTDLQFQFVGISASGDAAALAAVQLRPVSSIWIAPLDGSAPAVRMPSNLGHVEGKNGLTWLARGGIAYAAHISGNPVIMTSNVDGSGQRQLLAGVAGDYDPSSASSGQYLVFASNRTGGRGIWRLDLDTGEVKQLTFGISDWKPQVSPDGRWVIYASLQKGTRTIWKVGIDGKGASRLNQRAANSPAFSPDGRMVAAHYMGSGPRPRIGIFTFPSGALVSSIDLPPTAEALVSNPRWMPDGAAIAFVDTRDGVSNVFAQPIDGGPPRQLTRFDSQRIFKFEFSHDGQRIACARGGDYSDIVLMRGFQ